MAGGNFLGVTAPILRTPEFSFASVPAHPFETTAKAFEVRALRPSYDYDKAWSIVSNVNSWKTADDQLYYEDQGLTKDVLDSLDVNMINDIAEYLKHIPSLVWLSSMGVTVTK